MCTNRTDEAFKHYRICISLCKMTVIRELIICNKTNQNMANLSPVAWRNPLLDPKIHLTNQCDHFCAFSAVLHCSITLINYNLSVIG